MLNVLITDIFSMAVESFNEVVSLPVDSQLTIPIKFSNEHAHLFASNIEGIPVSFQISHPRVLEAKMDRFNQSLTLVPRGLGESNVLIYLTKNPEIFDVVKVKVAAVIEPSSPVSLHLGSEVEFVVDQNELDQKQVDLLHANQLTWFSSDPKVLDINSKTGKALAHDTGRVDVRVQMKGLNATTVAEVSKVSEARIIDNSALVLNVDYPSEDLAINLELYLHNSDHPLRNFVKFESTGATIRQNVGLKCETENQSMFKAQDLVRDN